MPLTKREIKVLIVDDDQDDYIITSEYIKHIPRGSFQIDWCPKYADALSHMERKDYDLYFVDYRLGARSGVDLLKDALAAGCEEPIVLLTGKGNYEVDIEAMQLGAFDYLIKTDLSTEKVERCIRYALDRAANIKALKANEKKYREIFEKSKDLIFLADQQLNFIDVNNAGDVILACSKEQMLEKNLCDFIEQAQHKKFIQQQLFAGNDVVDWEVVLRDCNGEKRNCLISAKLEADYTETPFVQGIIHDITNLKKMEKATLQGEKLAAAGRLVRTLAHEVRNPLNNITLSIEQMQQDLKDDASMVYMDIIQRNSRRISDLISQLLNTSRPSEITLAPAVFQSVLDEVIAASIDRLTLNSMKLKLHYPDTPVSIMADHDKLKLALLNIVVNAVEAMEEGKGELSLELSANEDKILLEIEDNGCGISEENISRLFEPYFTQKRNGVGLGLAFTLNILQSHHANIEVSSVQGVGTKFLLTFPSADNFSAVELSEQQNLA